MSNCNIPHSGALALSIAATTTAAKVVNPAKTPRDSVMNSFNYLSQNGLTLAAA
jgi:hypothetical protein